MKTYSWGSYFPFSHLIFHLVKCSLFPSLPYFPSILTTPTPSPQISSQISEFSLHNSIDRIHKKLKKKWLQKYRSKKDMKFFQSRPFFLMLCYLILRSSFQWELRDSNALNYIWAIDDDQQWLYLPTFFFFSALGLNCTLLRSERKLWLISLGALPVKGQ